MKEKIVPAVFLMLVLLIGFPSSVGDFNVFADDDDNDNLYVSSEKFEDEHEVDEHEVEIKGEIDEIDLVSMFFTLVGSLLQIFVNEDTEFKNFDEFSDLMPGFLVKVEIILSDDSHVATEIKIKDNGDEKDDKVTLCHIPKGNPSNAHTITVGAPAYRAHMAHGDLEGPCDDGNGTILGKYEDKLKKKLDKLEELRSKFEQKQIELAQKFADKLEKSTANYAEKEAKRAAKLLEKVESGEYYKDFIEVDAQHRTFVISFGTDAVPPLQGESIGQSSEISEFSGSITLKTSSSIDTRGTTKFIVEDCNLSNGDITYFCEYGKARTISSGPGSEKNSLVIIATLGSDDQEKRTGLKLSIETGENIRALEEGSFDVTVLSPQSKITHEWFLGGLGKMTILTESTEGSNGT